MLFVYPFVNTHLHCGKDPSSLDPRLVALKWHCEVGRYVVLRSGYDLYRVLGIQDAMDAQNDPEHREEIVTMPNPATAAPCSLHARTACGPVKKFSLIRGNVEIIYIIFKLYYKYILFRL